MLPHQNRSAFGRSRVGEEHKLRGQLALGASPSLGTPPGAGLGVLVSIRSGFALVAPPERLYVPWQGREEANMACHSSLSSRG
jgi:hypothetical protein